MHLCISHSRCPLPVVFGVIFCWRLLDQPVSDALVCRCKHARNRPQAKSHHKFPLAFKELVRFFLFIKPQDNCPISWMSNDILFYILNM